MSFGTRVSLLRKARIDNKYVYAVTVSHSRRQAATHVGLHTELDAGPKHTGSGHEKLLPLRSHAPPSVVAYIPHSDSGTSPLNWLPPSPQLQEAAVQTAERTWDAAG